MRRSKYHETVELESVNALVPAELKAKIFQLAARHSLPASHVIREALASYTSQNAA